MAPTTEIIFASMKPGSDISNPDTPEGKISAEVNATLIKQNGMQRLFWGTQVESPDVATMVQDWDSIDHHKAFQADPSYGPFAQRFMTILAGPPTIFHATLDPFPAGNAIGKSKAPVTEVLTAFFPGDYSTAEQESLSKQLDPFMKVISEAQGCTGISGGWSVENDIPHESGAKTKVLVALIGWQSIDAHQAARETQPFKDNIPNLRDAPKMLDMKVVHVPFEEVHGSAGA